MFLAWLTLLSGLSISAVAVYYSVLGLAAIFAASKIPILIMGVVLEVGKLVVAWWLKANWARAPWNLKAYLTVSVVILMFITSMGIFGFLSKAHTDQVIPTGDVQSQVALIDEKINNERETIANARTLLGQLDRAVTDIGSAPDREVNGRVISSAERALQVRRQQARDRATLTQTIEQAQQRIVKLQEEKAPFAKDLRAIEAEVGPIKYIAKLIYGDNTDTNILEMAVVWMILIIVLVFDPLAVLMLLAAQMSFNWAREDRANKLPEPIPVPTPEPKPTPDPEPPTESIAAVEEKQPEPDPEVDPDLTTVIEESQQPKIKPEKEDPLDIPILENEEMWAQRVIDEQDPDDDIDDENDPLKEAKRVWKSQNPHDSLKHQKRLLAEGKIDRLPWETDQHRESRVLGHGIKWPTDAQRSDVFIRTDFLPSRVFKYTGAKWIEVDKNKVGTHSYDENYITHLIDKIGTGEYDPELLSDGEREIIEDRLKKDLRQGQ